MKFYIFDQQIDPMMLCIILLCFVSVVLRVLVALFPDKFPDADSDYNPDSDLI